MVPTIRRGDVHSMHTHSVPDAHSLLTRTNMTCVLLAQELNGSESVIRSAMSSLCFSPPSLFQSATTRSTTCHGLLQVDTVHPEPLSQEPPPNTTWSESNVKEPLSHINCESEGNLRPNTPTEAVDSSTEEGWDASAVKDGDDDDRTRCKSRQSSARHAREHEGPATTALYRRAGCDGAGRTSERETDEVDRAERGALRLADDNDMADGEQKRQASSLHDDHRLRARQALQL